MTLTQDEALTQYDGAARVGRAATRSRILRAVAELREGLSNEEVAAALRSGSGSPIFGSVAWQNFTAELALVYDVDTSNPMFKTIRRAAMSALRTGPVKSIDFDSVAELAMSWMRRQGATLVTNVEEHTKQGIREVVSNAFREGQDTTVAARAIMDVKGFGLTRHQSVSLIRFTRELYTGGFPGSKTMSPAKRRKLINQKHATYLRQRARTVAHTEGYNAAAEGQRLFWSEAAAQGELDREKFVLQWVTRMVRTCPRCIALHGKIAEIDGGAFTSDTIVGGGRFDGTRITVTRPTVHPRCFCALRLVPRPE